MCHASALIIRYQQVAPGPDDPEAFVISEALRVVPSGCRWRYDDALGPSYRQNLIER
jgi:hypothetical protein